MLAVGWRSGGSVDRHAVCLAEVPGLTGEVAVDTLHAVTVGDRFGGDGVTSRRRVGHRGGQCRVRGGQADGGVVAILVHCGRFNGSCGVLQVSLELGAVTVLALIQEGWVASRALAEVSSQP